MTHIIESGNLRNHLARSVSGTLMLRVAGGALGFSTSVVLARLLGVTEYGIFANSLAWIGLLGSLATLGFHHALVRFVSVYRTTSDWASIRSILGFASYLTLAASVILMVGVAAAGWLIFDTDREAPMLRAMIVALPLLALTAQVQLRQATLRGLQLILRGLAPEMLLRPAISLTLVIAAWLLFPESLTAEYVIFLQGIAIAIVFGASVYWLHKALPTGQKSAIRRTERQKWIGVSFSFLLVGGFQIFNFQADIIILGALKGAEPAGIYDIVRNLAGLIVIMSAVIDLSIAPTIASLYSTKQIGRLQNIVTKSCRLACAIAMPLGLTLIFAGEIVLHIYGKDFVQGALALSVLATGQIFNAVVGPCGLIALQTGHEKAAAVVGGICAAANVGLDLLLIPSWGILGAAAATAFTIFTWNLLLFFYVRTQLGINSSLFALSPPLTRAYARTSDS